MSNDEFELIPIEPEEALTDYLEDKQSNCQEQTVQAHRYRLQHFVRWCEGEAEIENLNNLNGRHLQKYRHWRQRDGDLNNVTLHTQMTTFRTFLRWAEDYDAVSQGLSEKVRIPKLDRDEDVRDTKIEPERAQEILEYLAKFEYASLHHAVFRIMFRTGLRVGAVHALDLDDYYSRKGYIEVKHRPGNGTPLKNGEKGQRHIYLNDVTRSVLDDYIKHNRNEIGDDEGREPLFTSRRGRLHTSTLRQHIYKITLPCNYGNECPHGKDIEKCEWTNFDKASKCPSSESPHTVRRGAITYWLLRDTPTEKVSQRCNVNKDIIDRHYDKRTSEEKMDQRKDFFSKE